MTSLQTSRETSASHQNPGPQGLSIGFVTTADRRDVETFESLPIQSLWVGGHVAAPTALPEAISQLGKLAGLSERVRIGTSILLLPLYPPAIIAKQTADLDRETGGRLTLGIGVGGEYPQEFRACGIPIAERGRRTDEAIPLIRKLWSAEEISHDGPFYPMERVRIHPPPAQMPGPPIVVAGRKRPAMVRAATLGDGWMPYLFSVRAYGEARRQIQEIADEAGRDLSRFEWMQFLFINTQSDGGRARAEMAAFLGKAYPGDFTAMVDQLTAAGTPAEAAARVQAYVDAGARHFILVIATDDDRFGMAKRILEDVFPRVAVPGD